MILIETRATSKFLKDAEGAEEIPVITETSVLIDVGTDHGRVESQVLKGTDAVQQVNMKTGGKKK